MLLFELKCKQNLPLVTKYFSYFLATFHIKLKILLNSFGTGSNIKFKKVIGNNLLKTGFTLVLYLSGRNEKGCQ